MHYQPRLKSRLYNTMPLLLAAVSCLIMLLQLLQDKWLRGFDAYYYVVQADWWYKTGTLKIPDSSFVHYLVGILQYTGLSAEDSLRIWLVISIFLFIATFWLVIKKSISPVLAMLLFLWALLSPSLLFIAIEFPKTFSFLIVFNLWFLLLSLPKLPWAKFIILLFVGLLCHKMAIVYALALLAAFSTEFLQKRLRLEKKQILGLIILIAIFLLLYLLFIADRIHIADLLRLRGSKMTPGLISLFLQPGLPESIKVEFLFSAAILPPALLLGIKIARRKLLIPLFLIATAFMPSLGNESFSFGERFGIIFPYLSMLTIFYTFHDLHPQKRLPKSMVYVLKPVLLVIAIIISCLRLEYSTPNNIMKKYKDYAVISKELKQYELPMLILHRGIHFFYKYTTGQEAFSFEPEAHWNKQRVWRLVYGVSPEEFHAYLPAECGWHTEYIQRTAIPGYTLLREDCYVKLRNNVDFKYTPELFKLLQENEMNPSKNRPAFLYNKHGEDEKNEFSALPEHIKY